MNFRSSFLKSIFLVASGTALAQIVTILFSPVLTRIYSPEAFGVLGLFNAFIAFLLPLAALNYPSSIVLAKDEIEKQTIIKLSILIGFFSSFVVLFLIFKYKSNLVSIFNIEALVDLLMIAPLAMFFFVLSSIAKQVVIRKNKFNLYAKVSFYDSLIQNSSKFFSGLVWASATSLIVITSFGYLLNAILIYIGLKSTKKTHLNSEKIEISGVMLISTARKYKDFALYRTPQVILNSFSQNLPVLMLASYFGASAAGFFALSKMVLTAPVALIGQSVSTVFYPKFNESNNLGLNKFRLLLKANLSLLAIGAIPLVAFMIIAPWLFTTVFGEEWVTSGHLASWLSIWVFISLIAQPSVAAIPVLKIQAHYLCFEIVALIVRFLSLYISNQLKLDIIETIILFSISNFILDFILVIGVLLYASKERIK